METLRTYQNYALQPPTSFLGSCVPYLCPWDIAHIISSPNSEYCKEEVTDFQFQNSPQIPFVFVFGVGRGQWYMRLSLKYEWQHELEHNAINKRTEL